MEDNLEKQKDNFFDSNVSLLGGSTDVEEKTTPTETSEKDPVKDEGQSASKTNNGTDTDTDTKTEPETKKDDADPKKIETGQSDLSDEKLSEKIKVFMENNPKYKNFDSVLKTAEHSMKKITELSEQIKELKEQKQLESDTKSKSEKEKLESEQKKEVEELQSHLSDFLDEKQIKTLFKLLSNKNSQSDNPYAETLDFINELKQERETNKKLAEEKAETERKAKRKSDIQKLISDSYKKAMDYHKENDKTLDENTEKEIDEYLNSKEGFLQFSSYLKGMTLEQESEINEIYQNIIIPQARNNILVKKLPSLLAEKEEQHKKEKEELVNSLVNKQTLSIKNSKSLNTKEKEKTNSENNFFTSKGFFKK